MSGADHHRVSCRLTSIHAGNHAGMEEFGLLAKDAEGNQRMTTIPAADTPRKLDAAHPGRDPKKAAMSGWIGGALEYYDFALYSLAATLVFPAIFFPSENKTVAIIASLATYAV